MPEELNLQMTAQIAQFRFALIAPVIQGLYTESSCTAYYKRIAQNPLTMPDGSTRIYSYKTLEKWVSLYKSGGMDALMPRPRSDKGTTRVMSDVAAEEIFRLKEAFPRINATQIHQQLVSGSFIPATVDVSTVQRFIKKNDLKSARNPNMRDRKAFEEDAFGKLWQADTCFLPHITEDGKSRRVYCVMIIDDHARLIVGGRLFYNDNAYNFQTVLKSALSTYCIPDKLYCDLGSPYTNVQLSLICGSIGTVLLHTKIRDAASKAKIERSFLTLKERWLYTLDISSIHSLEQFNTMLTDYIRQYNTTFHTGIKCTPLERYLANKTNIRAPQSREWLDECFLNRIFRRVNKDSTVSIDNISYDAPMQFIRMKVEIRYTPGDMDSAFILYEKERYPLQRTDKNVNCHVKRRNTPSIDYSKAGGAK